MEKRGAHEEMLFTSLGCWQGVEQCGKKSSEWKEEIDREVNYFMRDRTERKHILEWLLLR